MYSAAEDDFIDFLVREVPDGFISPRLAGCKPGDLVEIGGPYGDFCLNESSLVTNSFVFIATGTGIAPFHSFVQTYPALKYQMFHGIRSENEKYDEDHYKVGSYIPSISQPEGGLVGQRLTSRLQSTELDTKSLYYLCGNRMMITDAIAILRGKGIPGSSIFTETFF
jgi:ferredoxin-NADP reductase